MPGIHTKCNAVDRAKSSEVDIVVANRQEGWLKVYPPYFLVECKNWENPVDSQSVSSFVSKVRTRGAELGILVAANGITGDPNDQTSAYNIIQNEQSQQHRIILVTLDQLRGVKTTDDFEIVLRDRFLATVALTF